MKQVAYGSLYLDEGETWEEKGKPQLDNILKSKDVIALFFDVLGYPEQEKEGQEMAKRVRDYAKSIRPDLDKISASFGVAKGNDKPRN